MKKILLVHKKEQFLVYVMPRKENTFERVLDRAIEDCKLANDKKGLLEHITKSLQRNGFKVLDLSDLEVRKV